MVGLTDPDTPVAVRLTVPLGAVAPLEAVSVTVTVQFDAWFATTGVEQDRYVAVE